MLHATRYHDISCGHRVVGHENKCALLHGHNYRIHFTCTMSNKTVKKTDAVGRVIDFAIIKEKLCNFLELVWDHKFLVWKKDPLLNLLNQVSPESIVEVPFNPTAENMAMYLIKEIGPKLLRGTNVVLTRCIVEETRKCSAEVESSIYH